MATRTRRTPEQIAYEFIAQQPYTARAIAVDTQASVHSLENFLGKVAGYA